MVPNTPLSLTNLPLGTSHKPQIPNHVFHFHSIRMLTETSHRTMPKRLHPLQLPSHNLPLWIPIPGQITSGGLCTGQSTSLTNSGHCIYVLDCIDHVYTCIVCYVPCLIWVFCVCEHAWRFIYIHIYCGDCMSMYMSVPPQVYMCECVSACMCASVCCGIDRCMQVCGRACMLVCAMGEIDAWRCVYGIPLVGIIFVYLMLKSCLWVYVSRECHSLNV